MLAIVNSISVYGMEAYEIKVEVDVSNGLPAFDIVGLPNATVRESKERVRTAIRNSGFDFPVKRITVNLAPADVKKEGTLFDLPVAVGIMAATGQIPDSALQNNVFVGELSLDGSLRGVNGVLAMAMLVKKNAKAFILPIRNAYEAALAGEGFVYGYNNLKELQKALIGEVVLPPYKVEIEKVFFDQHQQDVDFSDVKGQRWIKRALEIAATGRHNLLLIGSPGSGKTMLARRMQTIMPPLSFEESLFITKLYSLAGVLPSEEILITKRPFRAPHHTSSVQSMVGGGRFPKPGEISLATHGILFLDELPEYHRDVLESLRQPLEDGLVNVTRMAGSCSFPARPLLIAAMNPCPCGYLGDELRECSCNPHQIHRYLGKISGPILDRIDMHLHVPRVSFQDLHNEGHEDDSKSVKLRVIQARNIQKERFKGTSIISNAEMGKKEIKRYIKITTQAQTLLKEAFAKLQLSARGHDRILKVALTIADLSGSEIITEEYLAEALQYRNLDRIYQEI